MPKNYDRELGMILQEVKDFKENWNEVKQEIKENSEFRNLLKQDWVEVKKEIKENSKFRNQANTIVGFVAFTCSIGGGVIMWFFNKMMQIKSLK